jgi:O-antigen ligase
LAATEQPRLSQPLLRDRLVSPWPDTAAVSMPRLGQLMRLLAGALTLVVVFELAGRSEHPLLGIKPAAMVDAIRLIVPGLAALVAAYALYRPWRALLIVLALTPFWNSAYVSWQVGNVQVILQTIFVLALAVGAATTRPPGGSFLWSTSDLNGSDRRKGFAAFRLAEVAVAGLIGVAALSTVASHDVTLSATVLLHGILEPIALAAILVYLRPSRRQLVMLCVALGTSVALGTLINVVQTLPTMTSLAAIQADRLRFALASFYNVGLFAAVAAMTVPLTLAGLTSRRSMAVPTWATILMIATLGAALVGLFFSLSKSAWIATGGGTILLLLLLVHSWRRRVALVVASAAVSTLFIPWPAFVLQVAPNVNQGYRSVMVALVGESRFDSWNPATLAGRGSMSERFYAADAAVKMALANPLLGVGLDQFGVNYLDPTYRPPQALDTLDHAHSFFPEIGAELGLAAATLVFVIYAAALWAMWRVYRGATDQLTRVLAAGLMASIVSWLVVATAFGCDIYRPGRDLSSDVVVSAIVLGAAIALARTVHSEKAWRPSQPSRNVSR